MVFGIALVLLGALLYWAPSMPWLGRLPGDIRIEREGFRFYFPITSCLLLSAILAAILALLGRLR
jgi:hypothetical protein